MRGDDLRQDALFSNLCPRPGCPKIIPCAAGKPRSTGSSSSPPRSAIWSGCATWPRWRDEVGGRGNKRSETADRPAETGEQHRSAWGAHSAEITEETGMAKKIAHQHEFLSTPPVATGQCQGHPRKSKAISRGSLSPQVFLLNQLCNLTTVGLPVQQTYPGLQSMLRLRPAERVVRRNTIVRSLAQALRGCCTEPQSGLRPTCIQPDTRSTNSTHTAWARTPQRKRTGLPRSVET